MDIRASDTSRGGLWLTVDPMFDAAQALNDAQSAWEAGYAIVVDNLNKVSQSKGLLFNIATPPAPHLNYGALAECRHIFLDAMRRSLVPMPRESEIAPWSLGFVNDPENSVYLIGGWGLAPDDDLASVVRFLEKQDWQLAKWKDRIVIPVERHAVEWRAMFDEWRGKPLLTPTEARNKFCYEEWQLGQSLKQIFIALKRHPEWEQLADEKGVRGPIRSWAKKQNLPVRKGDRGRPRKS